MTGVVEIDGAMGEGGGQVLRTAIGLSLVTGKALRIQNIRANRNKTGLLRQHLCALNAAAEIGKARVSGNALHSSEISFAPTTIQGGSYEFAVGSAGSASLVLQTLLPALLVADEPSAVRISGGTDNQASPPFDFIQRTFTPMLKRMGVHTLVHARRRGFYPRGGGMLSADIRPGKLQHIDIGAARPTKISAQAVLAGLPRAIGERELKILQQELNISARDCEIVAVDKEWGPGNVANVFLHFDGHTETITAFGKRGVPAEEVAQKAIKETQATLRSGVQIGEHMADQLLLLLALAGSGSFESVFPSQHALTQAEVIQMFLPVQVDITKHASGAKYTVSTR